MRALSIVSLAFALGCATTETKPLAKSDRIPAATGELKAAVASNNNTEVQVEVKHLADPDSVVPGAKTYMVWAQGRAENATPHPLGALNVDKNLSAKLSTTTPMKNFDIFVTAERSTEVQQPSGERLMWGTVSM